MTRRKTLTLLASVAVLAALPAAAHEIKAGLLILHHPWTRATPPGASVAGGFVTIENTGSAPDRLLGGSFAASDIVEIHSMVMVDEVMTMRKVEGGLEIPAGGSLTLAPGGLHLMFIGLKRPLVENEMIDGSLVFEKAGTVPVSFMVESIGATAGSHAGGDGNGAND